MICEQKEEICEQKESFASNFDTLQFAQLHHFIPNCNGASSEGIYSNRRGNPVVLSSLRTWKEEIDRLRRDLEKAEDAPLCVLQG